MRKKCYMTAMLIWSVLISVTFADNLNETFKSPTEATKPWCYWYWLDEDISKEGITKDLENMAEVGIARAMIGNVTKPAKTDNAKEDVARVEVLSPEWRELKMHALREAKRVGVELYFFNGPGWSQSGGPWIKPEQSMRRVIWKEFDSNGGAFMQNVRADGVPGGGSQDIAVLAIPKIDTISIEGERTEKQYIFSHSEPFSARSLSVDGPAKGTLFAVRNGKRELVTKIDVRSATPKGDLKVKMMQTVSFPDVKAPRFELDYEQPKPPKRKKRSRKKAPKAQPKARIILSSAPTVAQVLNKQMVWMHPTPSPTWDSYIFDESVEPSDPSVVIEQKQILDLSDQLDADGTLDCTLPKGEWRIIYFGMITTGKKNHPASPAGTGLECDKMSKPIARHHFDSYVGSLIEQMGPEEKAAFKGVTIDSYEVGSQNWTDGFAAEFEKRNGYSPIPFLPTFTGRLIDSAKKSDQFLWDLRRTVADMIAENYIGGLRDAAHEHNLVLWCEPYGHWGFPGDFTIYGGYADQVGGEFWSKGRLGDIECRATSSVAHTYGKRRTYAEAFTSGLNLADTPYEIKARGERMFCDGINHFVLHVYAHQPRDGGMPGKNPGFGTAFHRNTPWFNESQSWIDYLQRSHTMLQWGDPANDVLVYIGDFAPQMTGPPNPVPNGYQYDYVGSDAILRKLDVVDGQWVTYDENAPNRISASWKVMTIPNTLKHVRPHIQKRIDELEKKGGKIIRSVPVTAKQLVAQNVKPAIFDTSCQVLWIERQLSSCRKAAAPCSPVAPRLRPSESRARGASGLHRTDHNAIPQQQQLNAQHLFFLSNFEKTGVFSATLRVKGKQPELMNPVTGEIRKLARYEATGNGTKIEIDVNDPADSCFVLFREKADAPSVVKASAPATELDLFYNEKNELVAETGKAETYKLTMSDGSTRSVAIKADSKSVQIADWKTESTDHEGFTETRVAEFNLPKRFSEDQRVVLDLGKVEIMAQVTLNGKTFDTLWMPPFTLDVTDALKAGQNKIAVRVTSTTEGKPNVGPVQLKTRAVKTIKK